MIWQKYFIKQFLSLFFLLLISFWGLYLLVDYSIRARMFTALDFSWKDVFYYYSAIFFQRLDILVPFALMIAIIRTVTALNMRRELMSLLTSGISMKKLLMPFLCLSFCATALLYLNAQFFSPFAYQEMRRFENERAKNQELLNDHGAIHPLFLNDNSLLLYHQFDPHTSLFTEAVWIKDFENIYHFKTLKMDPQSPFSEGFGVDYFTRLPNGTLALQKTFASEKFPELVFSRNQWKESLIPPQEMSLKQLWKTLANASFSQEQKAEIVSLFFFKLLMPWLCVGVFLAVVPFCVKFHRDQKFFWVYTLGMIGTLSFYLLMTTALVLAENEVFSPLSIIVLPFLLILGGLVGRYMNLSQ